MVVAHLLTLVTPAAAGDPAAAEKLFREGQALMDEGKHDDACTKFEASMALDPSAGTALNLALCNKLRGRTASAWAGYRHAAALYNVRGDKKRETFARERAAELEPGLSKLTIEAPSVAGLVVLRDDVEVPTSALGTEVPVDPGKHVVVAKAPRHEPWSGEVTVGSGGDAQVVTIPELKALPEDAGAAGDGAAGGGSAVGASDGVGGRDTTAPDSSPNALVITGGVLVGVGAVAAIIGGVLGGMVLSDASEAEDDDQLCGADKLCTQKGLDQIESAEGKALAANILIGAGAAVAVGGAVMLIVGATSSDGSESPSSSSAKARLAPAVGPDCAALYLLGTF